MRYSRWWSRLWSMVIAAGVGLASLESSPPVVVLVVPMGIALSALLLLLLGELDDRQLCCLWRHTFWELSEQHRPGDVHRLVALWQSCLDELERRDPTGLHAWLSSGARASSGPERFWSGNSRPGDAAAG